MLEEQINSIEGFGTLDKDEAGHFVEGTGPVLATPALAFAGGAALVTGAYAVGRAVG